MRRRSFHVNLHIRCHWILQSRRNSHWGLFKHIFIMSNPSPVPENAGVVTLQEEKRAPAKNCWSCRVLGAGGFFAAGVYVYTEARKSIGPPPHSRAVLLRLFATGLGAMGVTVLMDLGKTDSDK